MSHLDMPGDAMDFGALAARLAVSIDDVRACLLMSRDGVTLGVYPADREAATREVWERLLTIGQPERGFLVVGDELWIVARRGPYVGIVVASVLATPGFLLDRLELTLRFAEEVRAHEGSAQVGPRTEATRRPRTPLDREILPEPAPAPEEVAAWLPPSREEDPFESDVDRRAGVGEEAGLAEAVASHEGDEPFEPAMLDLSGTAGSDRSPSEPKARVGSRMGEDSPEVAPGPLEFEDGDSFDPVAAAMKFAEMTGAVGTIPTLPRLEPPPAEDVAAAPPVEQPPPDQDVVEAFREEPPPVDDVLAAPPAEQPPPDQDVAEAIAEEPLPLPDDAGWDPLEAPLEPLVEPLPEPLSDTDQRNEAPFHEDRVIASGDAQHPLAPDAHDPLTAMPLEPLDIPLEGLVTSEGEPEDDESDLPARPENTATSSTEEEAEVDPVVLAREFAQLFDDDEEAL
jgi:hypothetical protein